MKKKAKHTSPGKKNGKTNRKKPTRVKQELNPVERWKDVAALVESHATQMAEAVIGEAEKGQVAPVKYLFEMAGIQKPATDEDQKRIEEEDCLAKTLLDRLHIPTEPVIADVEDEEIVMKPARVTEEETEESPALEKKDAEIKSAEITEDVAVLE